MSAKTALLFDVGNTRLKWGVLENGHLKKTGSVTHDTLRESGFAVLTTHLPKQVDCVLASNVAGQTFATRLAGVIGIHCNRDVHFAHAEKSGFGVTNSYRRPRRIGVDRWVALIAARAELASAVCVVDAGTAVTIDAMDKEGMHLGGLIIPGLALMATSLHVSTGEIPLVKAGRKSLTAGDGLFANTTGGAIQNGALAAVAGAIDRSIAALRRAGLRPKVMLTGGDASRILKELNGNVLHRPHLVLQGLARMVPGKR